MGAIPSVATTRGLRSSAFDRHQEQMKTQLLPKDLAARAEKMAPEKVEAEVRRIVAAKSTPVVPAGLGDWFQSAQAAQLGPPPGAMIPIQAPLWAGAIDLAQQQQQIQAAERERQRLAELRAFRHLMGGTL